MRNVPFVRKAYRYRRSSKHSIHFLETGLLTKSSLQILPESTSSNLSVRISPARADVDVIIHRVQGPRDLIRGMNKEYAARYDEPVSEGWKAVRLVSSTGEEYGTLFEVRQAYQVWTDEKAKWEARNRRVGSG